MMILRYLVVLLSSLAMQTAQAATDGLGDDAGNGGDVVICGKGENEVIRFLDYWQAEHVSGLPPELGTNELNLEKKMDLVLGRIRALDPKRADRYKTRMELLLKGVMTDIVLPDINDTGEIAQYMPKECRIEQLMIKRHLAETPFENPFMIRRAFWQKLSVDDKVGAALHEAVWWDGAGQGHPNSRRSRFFNIYFSNSISEKFNAKTYQEFLESLRLVNDDLNFWVKDSYLFRKFKISGPGEEQKLADVDKYCEDHAMKVSMGFANVGDIETIELLRNPMVKTLWFDYAPNTRTLGRLEGKKNGEAPGGTLGIETLLIQPDPTQKYPVLCYRNDPW